MLFIFFFQAEDGIRDGRVTGVQTCALPIFAELPQPDRVVGLVQHQLGYERDRLRMNVGGDEGGGVSRHASIVQNAPANGRKATFGASAS